MEIDKAKSEIEKFLQFCQGRCVKQLELTRDDPAEPAEPAAVYHGADYLALITALRLVNRRCKIVELPPDKPPRIKANDWVIKDGWTKPMQVLERRSDTTLTMWHCGHIVRDEDVRVYRRSDAPLQKGDRGLLDGKIECWICDAQIWAGLIDVAFAQENIETFIEKDDAEGAFIRPDRFTLVEPAYQSKED